MSSLEEFARFKIPLDELLKATNNFADVNIIGQGGFGKVYKGSTIWSGQQTVIAARRLHYDYGQGDLEFWQEISMLSDLKNENLVSFVGYSNENGEKIIINKYEIHESLDKYLKGSTLSWTQRLQICVGIARALNYIHFDVGHNYSVIHRNVKSSKILVDDNWKPKLSGFEHALRNTSDRRHRLLLAEIIGTIGYVDPTYEKTGFVTHKSDVYSFGVVLFEILCGRRAFIPDDQQEDSANQDSKNGKLEVDTQFDASTDNNNTTQILQSSASIIGWLLSFTHIKLSWFTRFWLTLFSYLWPSSPSTNVDPSSSTNVLPPFSTNVKPYLITNFYADTYTLWPSLSNFNVENYLGTDVQLPTLRQYLLPILSQLPILRQRPSNTCPPM